MFDSMIAQTTAAGKTNKITLSAYQKFQKNFSFDALRGKHYGRSFAEYFGITDYRIQFERDWQKCDAVIKREWITNHAPCGV